MTKTLTQKEIKNLTQEEINIKLIIEVRKNNFNSVVNLLKFNPNLDYKDQYGYSALDYAVNRKQLKITDILMTKIYG